MTDIKDMSKRQKEHKVEATDGLLRTLPHIDDQIHEINEKIDECDAALETGCVSSHIPRASSQQTEHSVSSKHEEMILEKTMLEAERDSLIRTKESIENEVENLPDFQKALIRMRYTEHRTYDYIATNAFMSRDTVRREVKKALLYMNFPKTKD